MKKLLLPISLFSFALSVFAFDGLYCDMGTLSKVSNAKSRSISPENFTGEKSGGAKADPKERILNVSNTANSSRHLGKVWKVNPYLIVKPSETLTIAEIHGSGAIQQIWMTAMNNWRTTIIRFYWDGEETPSVECPIGDFFCCGFGQYSQLSSLAVCVNPGRAFNCYWKMPFRKSAKITIENKSDKDFRLFYQINYALTKVDNDEAYFHAQFRRSNPTENSTHTVLDGVKGKGQFVGAYFAWITKNVGWWGEGEVKFYLDGDTEFPTICGTGFEDYICGSFDFNRGGRYEKFSTPYSGLHEVIQPPDSKDEKAYKAETKLGLYRWHVTDPVRFDSDLRVTVQDLGMGRKWKYQKQKSDIASVAFWYQKEPHAKFPKLPSKAELEK